jgi:hypothetical protein
MMVRKLRYIASTIALAVLAASGAHAQLWLAPAYPDRSALGNGDRQVRCGLWRDLARDWHRWSSAERAVAVFLLFALPTMPAFFLIAWYW